MNFGGLSDLSIPHSRPQKANGKLGEGESTEALVGSRHS